MSVIGSLAGAGGQLDTCGMLSSTVTSGISTNSSSRMHFTTFGDSEAAELKGPGTVTAGHGGSEPAVGVSKDG